MEQLHYIINKEKNCVEGVKLEDENIIKAEKIILATGGKSYPLTGSTGDGYKMAKELVLSDGKKVKIKQGKGIDLLHAQMKAKTSEEIPYALIAELCEIDGNFLVYEDILELPIEDVITLQAAISGKFQLAQPSA